MYNIFTLVILAGFGVLILHDSWKDLISTSEPLTNKQVLLAGIRFLAGTLVIIMSIRDYYIS